MLGAYGIWPAKFYLTDWYLFFIPEHTPLTCTFHSNTLSLSTLYA